ncbi:hypothetical protein CK203_092810 [Vitis vinifera]|uniref:Uncharacterized protein n=1 Tax=Vitis vinifera TaxID=29760 RepID=A0A438EP57_VITVI|nr:hypothetical protein CK203_092810 [Vitis vinifera]
MVSIFKSTIWGINFIYNYLSLFTCIYFCIRNTCKVIELYSLPCGSTYSKTIIQFPIEPTNSGESSENNDASTLSVSNFSNVEKVDGGEDVEYIALDVLQWRWPGEQQSSMVSSDSDRVVNPQDMGTHSFLEVGAAALLVVTWKLK